MKLDTEALKPCPWCNAAPSEWKADGMFAAGCANKTSCNVQPHAIAPDQVTARVLWNRRAALPQSQDIRALVEELRQDAEMLRDGHQKNLTELWHSDVVKGAAINCDRAADALSCLAGEGWRPKVKPLEWEEAEGSYTALSALGEVYVDQDGDGFYAIENGRKHSEFATVEAAQAFVQANHNRWVGDWLDLPAPSVEEKLP